MKELGVLFAFMKKNGASLPDIMDVLKQEAIKLNDPYLETMDKIDDLIKALPEKVQDPTNIIRQLENFKKNFKQMKEFWDEFLDTATPALTGVEGIKPAASRRRNM